MNTKTASRLARSVVGLFVVLSAVGLWLTVAGQAPGEPAGSIPIVEGSR